MCIRKVYTSRGYISRGLAVVVTGNKILTFRSRTKKVLRVSFLNLEIICDRGSIGFEVLKKGHEIQYFCVYKGQNNRLQQLQAYEDIIKQTYLSSSIPGGNNLLAVTALDKSLSGSVLLESSVSSILFKGINKKI